MPTITKLVLDFKDADDLPKEEGLKIACFKILEGCKIIGHDWGFASFESGEFEQLEDGGRVAKVVKWAEMPNTKLLF